VAIARALASDPTVLVLDEPSTCLDLQAAERLLESLDRLTAEGIGILYLTSSAAEAERVAERVVVLRDGQNVGEAEGHRIERDRLQHMMIGRDLVRFSPRGEPRPGRLRVEVDGLVLANRPDLRHELKACAGQIIGLTGLVGSGCGGLLRALYGFERPLGGTVRLDGKVLRAGDPRHSRSRGMAYVPALREGAALFPELSLEENLGMASLGRRSPLGLVRPRAEKRLSLALIADLGLGSPWPEEEVESLSGSDCQKALIGRCLALRPTILMIDEPTWGVDGRTRSQIFTLLRNFAVGGGVVFFSSREVEEAAALADQVLVLRDGEIVGELRGEQRVVDQILQLAAGPIRPAATGSSPSRVLSETRPS
jgi:ribose transport system ATP-binding protein